MKPFVQLDSISLAIRAENIEAVAVSGEGEHEWALKVHVRGRDEPYKILGDQLYLAQLYKALLDHLGGVTNAERSNQGKIDE